jgi:hypothetical protein
VPLFFRVEQQFRKLGTETYSLQQLIPLEGTVWPRDEPRFFGSYSYPVKMNNGQVQRVPLQFAVLGAKTWEEGWSFYGGCLQGEIEKMLKGAAAAAAKRALQQGVGAPRPAAQQPRRRF